MADRVQVRMGYLLRKFNELRSRWKRGVKDLSDIDMQMETV